MFLDYLTFINWFAVGALAFVILFFAIMSVVEAIDDWTTDREYKAKEAKIMKFYADHPELNSPLSNLSTGRLIDLSRLK